MAKPPPCRQRKTKTPKTPKTRYVSWNHLGAQCTQQIRAVWGLGREKHCIDLTLINDNPTLMAMDAPLVLPAGSMQRDEHVSPEAIYFKARATVVLREY